MDLSDAAFEAANRRAKAKQLTCPAVVAVRYDRRISRIVISLLSGVEIAFSPRQAQGFENARPADLADAQISPSGLGVHFPKIDADIYIPALIEGSLGSKQWMAAQHGKVDCGPKSVAGEPHGHKWGQSNLSPKKPAIKKL